MERKKNIKFLVISDTHNQHRKLGEYFPEIFNEEYDGIIHAGDISGRGSFNEINDFCQWFSGLDQFKNKIFIAGNHDIGFEEAPEETKSLIPDNIIYLEDSLVEIEGVKIWGSPITPWFYDWAFNRERGVEIQKHWDLIPDDIDILVTHGPAKGIGDYVTTYNSPNINQHVGCEDLNFAIHRINPQYHIYGHIHEAYGQYVLYNTISINASVVNSRYIMVNEPVVIEI